MKNDRPEEYLGDPYLYYTDDEVEQYANSNGMRRAQQKIAYRVLELLNLKPGSSLLDVGSGPGYTAEVYHAEGYNVVCMDLIPKMIDIARAKGFEAHVGDMRETEEVFKGQKFDGVVSVSALQWVKDKKEIQEVAKGMYSVLNSCGSLVIQFYPKSEQELKVTAKVFSKNGFKGQMIVDWPEVPRKRTVYLVLKKVT